MVKSLLLNAALFAATGSVFGQALPSDAMWYGYYTGDESSLVSWGLNQAVSYDMAYRLGDAQLEGAAISALRFYVADVSQISTASVWLTDSLQLSSYVNVPTIEADTIVPVNGWNVVHLKTPYTIPASGVYVGYSFKVDKIVTAADYTPILLSGEAQPDGFYFHASQNFKRKWSNMYSYGYGNVTLQAVVSGGTLTADAACLGAVKAPSFPYKKSFELSVPVSNHGYNGLTSVDYSYDLNGYTGSGHADFTSLGEPVYGQVSMLSVELPAQETAGLYTLSLTLDKVNGVANPDPNKSGTTAFNVVSFVPTHRPLLEEYTGTWCGYCPRGYVGLQKMNELYPDDFVGISYHNGDPMEITSAFPNNVSGFPSAYLDRYHSTDAYYGDDNGYSGFAIDKTWEAYSAIETPADIEVRGEWVDAEQTQIDVTATVRFNIDLADAPYKIAYFLVADSLINTDKTSSDYTQWAQHNYYAGSTGDDGLLQFETGGSLIFDLPFNDILIDASAITGIEGSLTAPIVNDVPQSHTYRYDIVQAVNTSGVNLVQDKSKLRVAAAIVETASGKVINANKGAIRTTTGLARTLRAETRVGLTVVGDALTLSSNSCDRLHADVYTAAGELAASTSFVGSKTLSIAAGGLYVVRVTDGERVMVMKVVK